MIKVDYVDHMGSDVSVVNSARVSFGKSVSVLEAKDEKLMKYLADHDHLTPFEHCSLSVRIKCPLYIRSQIMRHRTFSYNEISRRYTSENLEFYRPEKYRKQHKNSKQCSDGEFHRDVNQMLDVQVDLFHQGAFNLYQKLLENGVARELARGILPQNLMTEFYMTGNIRNWVHFVRLRIDEHAQEEVRWIGNSVLSELKKRFPISTMALFGGNNESND